MARRRRSHRVPPGSSPGTLAIDPAAPRPRMTLIGYGPDGLEERELADAAHARAAVGRQPVTWINIDGVGDEALLRDLAARFQLHPLALEDAVHVHQRAKVEPYAEHLFIVIRMPAGDHETEQLSIFLGRDHVISIQEKAGGDCLGPVRLRLRAPVSNTRRRGADYLAYSLVDAAIDAYFPVLEALGDRLEALEEEMLGAPAPERLSRLHDCKRELLALRRAVWPLREATAQMTRDESPFISAETRVYLRDCHDHAVQLIDLVENYRELAANLTDLHLSSISNRMNEVMKVLTLYSTLFLPLTFIAGVYGMNFKRMPEIEWPWGYGFALGLMVAVAGGMLWWFRRRGWLGEK